MISGLPELCMTPKTNITYLWRHQETFKNPREIQIISPKYVLGISKFWKSSMLAILGKRAPANPEDPSHKFWESWMRYKYLPEIMKWEFGHVGSSYSINIKLFLKLWIFETSKLWKVEMQKRKKQETLKLWFVFQTNGIPSTPQHTDSNPCTSHPPGGHEGASRYRLPSLHRLPPLYQPLIQP